jgi:ribosomal protein S18 acetylase RimI-like enzyme
VSVTLSDWRDAPETDVAPLYASETLRWRERLLWDTRPNWAVVEAGRRGGNVAGWLLRGRGGRCAGWTFYHLDRGTLQIGALCAESPSLIRQLLAAVLSSPEAALADTFSCFVFPDGPALASALRRQRFTVRESLYLHAGLATDWPAPAGMPLRAWQPLDLSRGARLLQDAYRDSSGAALFAPAGADAEWGRYLAQLVYAPGCGAFDPALSPVIADAHALAGMAVVTRLADDVAHLAQLAVAPAQRRRGCAIALLQDVQRRAREAGLAHLTLMVDRDNAPARALYDRLAFVERGVFLHAHRGARRRVAA